MGRRVATGSFYIPGKSCGYSCVQVVFIATLRPMSATYQNREARLNPDVSRQTYALIHEKARETIQDLEKGKIQDRRSANESNIRGLAKVKQRRLACPHLISPN
jgi:hypothetical protein